MVLGKFPVPGRPTIWLRVGQGPIALAVGAGGGCLDIFILIYPFSHLSPSLWETARYRLKYCLKGPLDPEQPTNQSNYRPISLTCVLCKVLEHIVASSLSKHFTELNILYDLRFSEVFRKTLSNNVLYELHWEVGWCHVAG